MMNDGEKQYCQYLLSSCHNDDVDDDINDRTRRQATICVCDDEGGRGRGKEI